MANDRVFIRCKVCGQARLLFKFWGAGDVGDTIPIPGRTSKAAVQTSPNLFTPETKATAYDDTERVDSFQAWLQEHLRHCSEAFGGDLNGDPGFTLDTESKEKWDDESPPGPPPPCEHRHVQAVSDGRETWVRCATCHERIPDITATVTVLPRNP